MVREMVPVFAKFCRLLPFWAVFLMLRSGHAVELEARNARSQAVFCETLLNVGANIKAGDPWNSLHNVQKLLRNVGNIEPRAAISGEGAYRPQQLAINLIKPQRSGKIEKILARLRQLERDTTALSIYVSFEIYEFRGRKQVTQARNALRAKKESDSPLNLQEVDRRFPKNRIENFVQYLSDWLCYPSSVAMQLQMIDQNLSADSVSALPFSIRSSSFDERDRHVFYDSIFFVDPETKDPVWLFYYRAFKDVPTPPRKPELREEGSEDQIQMGLIPGLVPIKVKP
jgi:hypothetical protein